MSKASRFKQAFQENFNMVGLAGAAALSAALLNPLPLLVGIVAEAAYLLFVPDSKWYDARLAKRFDAEVEVRRAKLRAEVFPQISGPLQERFDRLDAIRRQIDAQPLGMADATWFREIIRKLDYLLEKFLLFASKEAQFRAYLQGVLDEVAGGRLTSSSPRRDDDIFDVPRARRGRGRMPRKDEHEELSGPAPDMPPRLADRWAQESVKTIEENYDQRIAAIQTEREGENDGDTQAVLDKRIDVLQQRREYVGKIGRILTNLGHQMELLEDSFGLINDQLRARSPEQVLADIEGVVYQTEGMTRLLDELAPYEQMSARLSA